MGKYVLVGILLALLQCVTSLPQNHRYPGRHQHKDKPEKKSSGNEDDGGKIIWGGNCSPRYTVLYTTQDSILECEVFVPPGTVLTWYKGNQEYNRYLQAELVKETTNDVKWNGLSLPHLNPGSTVHISAVLYLDCVSSDDKGDYMLSVKTPNGRIQNRFFELNITVTAKYHRPGGTCSFGHDVMAYIPRVYQYAKHVMALRGTNVIVPCRVLGLESTLRWSFQNRPIENSEKYQVLANGDLLIRDATLKDRGTYICKATSNIAPTCFDVVITFSTCINSSEA